MKSILCDDNAVLSHSDLFKNIPIMSDIIRFTISDFLMINIQISLWIKGNQLRTEALLDMEFGKYQSTHFIPFNCDHRFHLAGVVLNISLFFLQVCHSWI